MIPQIKALQTVQADSGDATLAYTAAVVLDDDGVLRIARVELHHFHLDGKPLGDKGRFVPGMAFDDAHEPRPLEMPHFEMSSANSLAKLTVVFAK